MTAQTDTTVWIPRQEEDFVTLQDQIAPEAGISTERDLYFRLKGAAGWSQSRGQIEFAEGGQASFDTWFNLFNIGKWHNLCDLRDLHLMLQGQGRFELRICLDYDKRSGDCIHNDIITLQAGVPFRFDLSAQLSGDEQPVAFFKLRALQAGARLDHSAWQTRQAPLRSPDLMLSVTTFRREEAVRATVRRFEDFMTRSTLAPKLHLTVVDNGKSAGLTSSAHVSAVDNENLGGSGGFSRGLQEARARGASHCLFMDDDASIHMQSLERTWMLLAYAKDPATAVAGAMTSAAERYRIWENGAVFHRSCRPLHMGTDLRDAEEITKMECETTRPAPGNFYGGWWYFAFPVDRVTYDPFPFFVRGDDVSFSLANDFCIARLNGVVCFQDADFADKESLQTLYLDLRSHMAHHLALPAMELGRKGTLRIPAWFFARSLVQLQYETLAALNLSFEDVMKGPAFFRDNADMADRRATIGALRTDEALRVAPPPPERRRFSIRGRLGTAFMLGTLNGHLLPFFGAIGNHVTLRTNQRGQLHPIWGASRITWHDERSGQSFTMRHSKRRAWAETRRFLGNAWAFWRNYDAIRDDWRQGYRELASEGFWRGRLGLEVPATAPDAPQKKDAA